MAKRRYTDKQRICEDFGERMKYLVGSRGLSRERLGEVADELGIGPEALDDYVICWTIGCPFGTTSSSPRKPVDRLSVLSGFLNFYDVSEEDPIVETLRELDIGFEYPPRNRPSSNGVGKV